MSGTLTLDGTEHVLEQLNTRAQVLARQIAQTQQQIDERLHLREVLLKARAAYLAELRTEVIQQQSGVDLTRLLDDY